jgi:hypothetical protein
LCIRLTRFVGLRCPGKKKTAERFVVNPLVLGAGKQRDILGVGCHRIADADPLL